MGKMKNLLNQKFGQLTVIECMGKIDKRHYYWKCKCDCGNETIVSTSQLTSGNTKSCGCLKSIGIKKYNQQQSEQAKIPIGTRYGKLIVLSDLGMREQVPGHNRRWYKCQCDCGNICDVQGNRLKQGQTISCGKCIISKGEYLIKELLDNHNIIYNHDVQIPTLTKECGKKLRFDFVIYENNMISRIIEFDGRQHYTGPDTLYWGHTTDTLQSIQERDNIKNNWCIKNNIPLIRIPYTKINTITFDDLFNNTYLITEGDDDKSDN